MEHNDTQNTCLLFSPGVENNHWIKLRKFFIKKASSVKKHILSVVISRKIPLSSTHSKLVLEQRDQLFKSCKNWRRNDFSINTLSILYYKNMLNYNIRCFWAIWEWPIDWEVAQMWFCMSLWKCCRSVDLQEKFRLTCLRTTVFRIPKKLWFTVLKN